MNASEDNPPEIIDAQIVDRPIPEQSGGNSLLPWQRLLIGLAFVIVFGLIGGSIWIFGMLMFTFSLDGATSGKLPNWIELYMLIGWPVTIGLVAIVPPALFAFGTRIRWPIIALLALSAVSAIWFLIGWISVIAGQAA